VKTKFATVAILHFNYFIIIKLIILNCYFNVSYSDTATGEIILRFREVPLTKDRE